MFAPIWKGYFPEENHVGYVTNGVHLPTWCAAEWKSFSRTILMRIFLRPVQSENLGGRLWHPR